MNSKNLLSRRSFLGSMMVAPAVFSLAQSRHIPIGLELYSVRDDLQKDLQGTVRSVAKMGYQCVEFFGSYVQWTPSYARQVRAELDELGIHCYSTHNDLDSFTPKGMAKAVELNKILGTRYMVLAYPGEPTTLDDWKRVGETLNKANDEIKKQGLHAGYHNHDAEWKSVAGRRPMDVLGATLTHDIMLQLDVGTCVAAGGDPVAWIRQNPGRIRSMHLKDWSPQRDYKVLFGEGVAPWKQIFAAGEKSGGVEYYLIEQEGSDYSEIETARRCLAAYRTAHV